MLSSSRQDSKPDIAAKNYLCPILQDFLLLCTISVAFLYMKGKLSTMYSRYVLAIAMTLLVGMAFAQSSGGVHSAPILPQPNFSSSNQNASNASYNPAVLPRPDLNASNQTLPAPTFLRPQPDLPITYNATQAAIFQEWLTGSPLIFRLLGI